jgi:outer membrane protein OmpA-like peptidoglycan-associated protein
MKSLWIASFWLLACLTSVFAQANNELPPGYYVVVAAYSLNNEVAAEKYTKSLQEKGIEAKFGFNSAKKLFFVYVYFSDDFKSALSSMKNQRKSAGFSEAWVRIVGESFEQEPVQAVSPPAQVEKPVDNEVVKDTPIVEKPVETAVAPEPTVKTPEDTIKITDNEEIKQFDHMTLGNTEVFVSMFNSRNNKIIDGKVKVIDSERNKLLTEIPGNDYLYLPDPNSTSGKLTLICESFGYRKTQAEINYPLPLADTVKENVELLGTTFIIYFDMIRYSKGETATLYNVYFYNDAAVMLPESKFELTSLLDMMKENPDYRVRLHGHTNGNYHGRIITMGKSRNFFSLDGSANSIGSAKDLSFARADVIKQYLVANGIKADRIEVKAWGGKKPLYDKHSANAKRNVRVEVEIIEE